VRVEEIIEHTPPGEVDALLLEIGAKNTVRVVLHKASRGPRCGYTAYRKVLDEMGETTLHRSALLELDTVRMLRGLEPRYLPELARLAEWDSLVVGVNIRTNAGIDYVADSLGNNASRPAVAQYMALSNDGTAPAAGDTTLAGEITSGTDSGLARAVATYAHTTTTTTYTLQKTFTAAATEAGVQKDGIFTASSVGILFVSSLFTATPMVATDQLTLTHSITI
jgi:hypothetical protein